MVPKRGPKKSVKSAGKRGIKDLSTKTLKADQARRVKGGAFIKMGDIKGE